MESVQTVGAVCVCILMFCACTEAVNCAVCSSTTTCPPKPTGCALSREPCGCCDICALGMGARCHGYSAGCGPGLICLTPIGPFPQRPPENSNVHGRCVRNSNPVPPTLSVLVPPTIADTLAPPKISVGRK